MTRKYNRIAVLYGGFQADNEFGVRNGKVLAQQLKLKDYDVVEIDVDFTRIGEQIKEANVEAIVNVAWGKYAEDGKLQAYLDTLGIPYTGARARGFLIGRDKLLHKLFFKDAGLPQMPFTMFHRLHTDEEAKKIILDFGLPAILKPSVGGSSIGTRAVLTEDQIDAAIAESRKWADNTVIERFIVGGQEIGVNVIEVDGEPIALPIIDVNPDGLFHMEGLKFTDKVQFVCPSVLPEDVQKLAKDVAIKAFKVCDLMGFARLDMMVKDGVPYILEMNPLPGTGMMMRIPAEEHGWTYPELAEKLLLTAR